LLHRRDCPRVAQSTDPWAARNDTLRCHCEQSEAISPNLARTAAAAALAVTAAILAACEGGAGVFGGPGPFVRAGNAESVEIGFIGDVSNAMPLARKHCAQFERVPRYAARTLDGAEFDCVRPGS
jgi:hypothetical protein